MRFPTTGAFAGMRSTRVMHRFGDAIRGSVRCAVASSEMKEAYERRYGTPCVPMIHGLPESQWIPPTGMRPPNEPFVIGYAGSLYARREWDALIAALGAARWRIGGRDTIVRVLAAGLDVRVTGPARIEFLGWHSTTDAVKILSDCDVCYVPYWFDEAFRPGVELSFPNKVSLYLAAGRPILYHGPERATPTRFLERWPVGVSCHSLEPQPIADALTRRRDRRTRFTTVPRPRSRESLRAELGPPRVPAAIRGLRWCGRSGARSAHRPNDARSAIARANGPSRLLHVPAAVRRQRPARGEAVQVPSRGRLAADRPHEGLDERCRVEDRRVYAVTEHPEALDALDGVTVVRAPYRTRDNALRRLHQRLGGVYDDADVRGPGGQRNRRRLTVRPPRSSSVRGATGLRRHSLVERSPCSRRRSVISRMRFVGG